MRQDPLAAAIRALNQHHPECLGAFVGGSIFRGEGTSTSDIDVVVLYDNSFEDVHRESLIVDEWPLEFFVHSIEAQDYFLEKDRARGMCVLPELIVTGTIVPSPTPETLEQQRKAKEIIAEGPPLLSSAEIDRRRYILTDLVEDIIGADSVAVKNAALARLHDELGDFHLRACGKWSGYGKALLRCFRRADKNLAERFELAFAQGFASATPDAAGVVSLAEDILAPHGGRLWEGYAERAHPGWRT